MSAEAARATQAAALAAKHAYWQTPSHKCSDPAEWLAYADKARAAAQAHDAARIAYFAAEQAARARAAELTTAETNAAAEGRRDSAVPSGGLLDAALDEHLKRGGRIMFWTCPNGCRDIVDWNHDGGKSVATCRKCGTSNAPAEARKSPECAGSEGGNSNDQG